MPTVDRVLPWRRNAPPPAEDVAPLLDTYRARHGRSTRTDMITRAYEVSAAAHEGQVRRSGEAYISSQGCATCAFSAPN